MDKSGDLQNEELLNEELELGIHETLSQFYGPASDVVERYMHCVLCGANLHFSHITDFTHSITHEMARCPECGTRARKVSHRLQ